MNRICPQCMSSHLVTGDTVILGAGIVPDARCLNCGWTGKDTELIGIPSAMISKHMGDAVNPDQALVIIEKMAQHFLSCLASRAAKDIGLALVESGFVGLQDRTRLGRLIRATCLAAVRGALTEAEQIQKEVQRDGQRAS